MIPASPLPDARSSSVGFKSPIFKAAQVEPGEGPSGRGCGRRITASPVLEGALMPALQTRKTASRCTVCNRGVERIPPRDLVSLCCVTNGRMKHPTLEPAAQVIHKSSSLVFWERNPLCHSSVLLSNQWEKQPVNRDASSHLRKLIKAVKIYLVSQSPDKEKIIKTSHFPQLLPRGGWGKDKKRKKKKKELFLPSSLLKANTFGEKPIKTYLPTLICFYWISAKRFTEAHALPFFFFSPQQGQKYTLNSQQMKILYQILWRHKKVPSQGSHWIKTQAFSKCNSWK